MSSSSRNKILLAFGGLLLFALGFYVVTAQGFFSESVEEVESNEVEEEGEVEPAIALDPGLADAIELDRYALEGDEDGRYIVGRLRNVSGRPLRTLSVQFDLYDAYGNEIGAALEEQDEVAPGEVWEYAIPVGEEEATDAKLIQVKASF